MTVDNEQLKVIFRQALGFIPKYVKTTELTDGKILLEGSNLDNEDILHIVVLDKDYQPYYTIMIMEKPDELTTTLVGEDGSFAIFIGHYCNVYLPYKNTYKTSYHSLRELKDHHYYYPTVLTLNTLTYENDTNENVYEYHLKSGKWVKV
ncbi:MAG: hypothetical protein WC981_03125 [Candidatus Dojkabacteria bacterium]